ncbi:MAG: DNA polymerase III subunit chi [Burkholderiales bacterium]
MTEIQFHFNVPDRLAYACRLLRKAMRTVRGISVLGEASEMEHLNRQLWSFEPSEFLPHLLLRASEKPTPALTTTPIWLLTDLAQAPCDHKVLVNLGVEPVTEPDRYQRLVEIVSRDQGDRDAARLRWRHYAGLGLPIEKFEVSA